VADGHLAHVRWLGGASGGGKTTVAALLADRYQLQIYSTDLTIRVHGAGPGPDTPRLAEFIAMSMDQRWLERDPVTMLNSFPWFAGERFDRIVRDLRHRSPSPPTVAEGFRLLPRLVHPLLEHTWQAVWLVPAAPLRRTAFERRPPDQQFWRLTSNPREALDRLLERDELFAQQLAAEAHALGLKVISVDGKRPVADVAVEVAAWFRLHDVATAG
jgi:hypothetical protein